MGTLCDDIEAYFKWLIDQATGAAIEIRRRDIAEMFDCVPSQINYVLQTRFTPDRGYVVESRRGGGGYIRILRIHWGSPPGVFSSIYESMGDRVTRNEAEDLLVRLEERRALTPDQVALIKAALRRETRGVDDATSELIRALVLRCMLLAMLGA